MNKSDKYNGQVIRNPLRTVTRNLETQKSESFQTEYSRLGIEPVKRAVVSETDFRKDFRNSEAKRTPMVTSSAGRKPVTPFEQQLARVKVVGRAEVEVPEHFNVSSGQNNEHAWYPAEESQEQLYNDILYDDVPFPPGHAKQQHSTKTARFENQNYDESDSNLDQNGRDEAPELTLADVKNDHFCLVVGGNIIHVAASLDAVEKVIEFILFDINSPFKNITADDLQVFKSLSLRVGVLVKE